MPQTLLASEKAINHEDGLNMTMGLQRIAQAVEKLAEQAQKPTVYAFHIDGTESVPASKVTYLEDASGFTPAAMDYTNGKFDYGSWANAFFMPRPCMVKSDGTVDYYLLENDYTKKTDGTASDVANTSYDGNAMMEWGRNGKKIWYKIVPDTGDTSSATVYIADEQVDPDYVAWSFVNNQGNYVDHFYTAIYNGSNGDASNKMRSLSGQAVKKSLTGQNEIIAAELNNPGTDKLWYTDVFCDRILIDLLLVLIGKSTDTETVFGNGLITGSETALTNYVTGALNDKGLFFGYSDQTHAVKVFGMENWWGAQWRRTAGLNMNSGVFKYKMTYPYTTDSQGYVNTEVTPTGTSGGYISKMVFLKDAFVAGEVSGTSSTHYCDGQWWNASGDRWSLWGGSSLLGVICGAFSCDVGDGLGGAVWAFGSALSLKPLA